MKLFKGLNSTRTTIISIIILDIILMTLFIFFSDLILRDFQNSSNISTFIISAFAVVVPGTLIILIIYQFYRLFKKRKFPGFSIKKNIVIYYTVATILVIVPQTIISINFINTATDNWLNKDVKESLNIGLDIAIDMYNDKVKELENLGSSRIFNNLIKDVYKYKDTPFLSIKKLNNTIDSIHFYSISKELKYFIGDESHKILQFDSSKNFELYPKISLNNTEFLSYQYKLYLNGEDIFLIISSNLENNFSKKALQLTKVKEDLEQVDPHRGTLNLGIFVYYTFFSLPLFLLAILGSFIFSDEIVRPIANIEDAIESVSKGNYSYRILSKKNNEFNLLINSFNNMIKEIETSRNKLKHTEQISTWQDIATRLAHEIRNPLTPIKLSAQKVLLKNSGNENINKSMQTIITEVTRMEKLLTEFRDFARFPNLNIEKENISTVIQNCIDLYKEKYTQVKFNFTPENIELKIDKNQINQVISNLIINAIHATDDKGLVDISVDNIRKKSQEYCKISIRDNGHGIKTENINNIFKPYYTTKYDGTGLGLAIVNKIVLDHKGKIWIESAINRGTTFYIELPKD